MLSESKSVSEGEKRARIHDDPEEVARRTAVRCGAERGGVLAGSRSRSRSRSRGRGSIILRISHRTSEDRGEVNVIIPSESRREEDTLAV